MFHWFICLSHVTPHRLDSYSFLVNFEIRKCESSNFFFFFKIGLFSILCTFIWILESTCQFLEKLKGSCNSDRDWIEPSDPSGEYCRFNDVNSPSFLTWFRSSLIYFSKFGSFQGTHLALHLLNVLLSILLFLMWL